MCTMHDVHVERFQDANERTDKHPCLGLEKALRKSPSSSPTASSLPKSVLLSHSREIQKKKSLEKNWNSLPERKGLMALAFVASSCDFTAKDDWQLALQAIYFGNQCGAIFSTDRLKIFKCTLIKCLLETNLASIVKSTNMRSVHFTYVCFRLQVEKVKIYPDIPYVLPKSYSKLAADRRTVSENVKTVECQVTEEPARTMGLSERC